MTDDDERELHRLCDMLKEVDGSLEGDSPLREAVSKGAIALSFSFIHGFRAQLEDWAVGSGRPVTEAQRAFLSSIGIDSIDP